MVIRAARPSEQEAMARIAAQAFWSDELFGDLIHPQRQQFPEDMYLYWLKRLRMGWNMPFNRFLVTTVQLDGQPEILTGMAQWTRKGIQADKDEALAKHQEDGGYDLPENRAADPEMENVLERSYGFLQPYWQGPRYECWDLTWLAVLPEHQGEGHGRVLVKYGLDLATEERVAASVVSAYGKETFYERCGFKRIGAKAGDGEGNPLCAVKGGHILFRDGELARPS